METCLYLVAFLLVLTLPKLFGHDLLISSKKSVGTSLQLRDDSFFISKRSVFAVVIAILKEPTCVKGRSHVLLIQINYDYHGLLKEERATFRWKDKINHVHPSLETHHQACLIQCFFSPHLKKHGIFPSKGED